MKLAALPAFADNSICMLHDGSRAVAVDPGGAAPAHAALQAHGAQLAAILVTHHHAHHVGGLHALSGGCGLLFERTAEQMHESRSRLAALPADAKVCCAHEYTVANLRFARAVEPDNARIAEHAAWCDAQRARTWPTLPSRTGPEREINPLRHCDVPAAVEAAVARGAVGRSAPAVFAALREWKNTY